MSCSLYFNYVILPVEVIRRQTKSKKDKIWQTLSIYLFETIINWVTYKHLTSIFYTFYTVRCSIITTENQRNTQTYIFPVCCTYIFRPYLSINRVLKITEYSNSTICAVYVNNFILDECTYCWVVICNNEHPDDSQARPKEVGAINWENIHHLCILLVFFNNLISSIHSETFWQNIAITILPQRIWMINLYKEYWVKILKTRTLFLCYLHEFAIQKIWDKTV